MTKIELVYQKSIPGIKNATGGYLVYLTHYHHNVPILFGLEKDPIRLSAPERELKIPNPKTATDELEFAKSRNLGFDKEMSFGQKNEATISVAAEDINNDGKTRMIRGHEH